MKMMTLNLESNNPWMWENIFSDPNLDAQSIRNVFNEDKFFGEQLNLSMASHHNSPVDIVIDLIHMNEDNTTLILHATNNLIGRCQELRVYIKKKQNDNKQIEDQIDLYEENKKLKKACDLLQTMNNE